MSTGIGGIPICDSDDWHDAPCPSCGRDTFDYRCSRCKLSFAPLSEIEVPIVKKRKSHRVDPETLIWPGKAKDRVGLMIEQDYRCKGCGIHQSEVRRAFALDHCHLTNVVRGLFCDNCNIIMGLAHDDSLVLRNLADIVDAGWTAYEDFCEDNPVYHSEST
jgi:predicted SprT family Zn-dependent metalloprotease